MPKANYEYLEAIVRDRSDIWQDRLGLSHVEIEHVFLDTFEGAGDGSDFHTTACTETRWQYLQAKIKWYLPSLVRHDERTVEAVLVHELVHVLLAAEQTLIDVRLEGHADADQLGDVEYERLQAAYYERLELTTEMTSRAFLRAWTTEE